MWDFGNTALFLYTKTPPVEPSDFTSINMKRVQMITWS